MFTLSTEKINPDHCIQDLKNGRAGAMVSFEGWVRDHNDGRPVAGLTYEAYEPMAVSEGTEVLQEAKKRYAILDAHVVHLIGEAGIGDRAVWVGVTAEHRQEAFLAGRWIMDEIKRRVPIWKKEKYTDNTVGEWVHASDGCRCSSGDPVKLPQYQRQVSITGFGSEGQRKLANATAVVVGAGGLGCPALQYLAGAGIGSLRIVDGDTVDVSNLHRQILFGFPDIGRNKAEAAAGKLRELNPNISIQAIADAAYPDTLASLLEGADVVLDCTDGFESKYAIADACWKAGKPVVQASVHQYDGWLQIIDPSASSGCFRCQWPEAPPPGCIGTCAESGVLGITPGTLGIMQAAQAIGYLAKLPDILTDATLYMDVFSGQSQRVQRTPSAQCQCRQNNGFHIPSTNLLFPGLRAKQLVQEATVVDIREPKERENDPDWIQGIPCQPKASWSDIPDTYSERPLVLCCSMGIRTRACVELLGHPDDIYAWTKSIHELPRS
jgi:adenylyltransferase/sulfurtransferase